MGAGPLSDVRRFRTPGTIQTISAAGRQRRRRGEGDRAFIRYYCRCAGRKTALLCAPGEPDRTTQRHDRSTELWLLHRNAALSTFRGRSQLLSRRSLAARWTRQRCRTLSQTGRRARSGFHSVVCFPRCALRLPTPLCRGEEVPGESDYVTAECRRTLPVRVCIGPRKHIC